MRRSCIVNGCPNRFEIDPYALRKPSKCPKHRGRGWERRSKAPAGAYAGNWPAIRAQILRRDPWCMLRFPGCERLSVEVDHVLSVADGGDNSPSNLRGACRRCHARRTGRQGALAKQRRAKHLQSGKED